MRLQGKVALITGSGRGIGAAMARGFASEGADVVLISRTISQLKEQKAWIKEHTSASVLTLEADVGKEADVQQIVEAAVKRFGHIDILANCAGITMVSPSESLSLDNWHKCLRINLDGTFLCCQKVGAHMIEHGKGGKIINITSIAAHAAIPERAAYAASKGGVMQLTQNLAVEVHKEDIIR